MPDVLQDAENAADNICLERIQQPAKPQSEYYFNMPRRPWKPVEPGLNVAFYFNMLRHCVTRFDLKTPYDLNVAP